MSDELEGVRYAPTTGSFTSSIEDPSLYQQIPELGTQWSRFVLGDADDPRAAQVWIVTVPPGFTIERHYHNVHRLEVQLKGRYLENGVERGPGSVTMFVSGEWYGPLYYPEGGTSLEVFSSSEDVQPYFAQLPSEAMARNLTGLGMAPRLAPTSS